VISAVTPSLPAISLRSLTSKVDGMCGIAGIYSYNGGTADRHELLSIRDAMFARGPDGAGLWWGAGDRVGLAHRRLSIIDLSEAGAQPMREPATGNSTVYNGEIYNYRELKRELEAAGRVFRSQSDTEVLLHLYALHGIDMLRRLRGMYAFAIWDESTASLFMARDPTGIKPLYYADDGRSFRFASQVRALLKGKVDSRPEPAGHAGFFLWGSVPEPFTMYRGIRSLPAGHWIQVDRRGASTPTEHDSVSKSLATASTKPLRVPKAEALTAVATAVKDSVTAHLVADVPVGVFLSAGLDSTMIAGCAGAVGELRTVTLGFREYAGTRDDEVPLAEETARGLGATHTTVRVERTDFEAERARMLAAMDQPSIDGVNTWFVARATAAQGLKVALSGLGGDELFGSYPSFRDVPRMVKLFSPFAGIPAVGVTIRRVSVPLIKYFTSPKYAGLLEYGGSLGGAYLLRRGLFMPWELPEVLDPDLAREGWRALEARARLQATTNGIENYRLAVTALEMSWYMRNQLLRDADWAGMAHSLEIRVPLVDMALLSSVAPLLASLPNTSKRQIAAALAPQLPSAIFARPKTGFSVPVQQWLSTANKTNRGLRNWAREVYVHGDWRP